MHYTRNTRFLFVFFFTLLMLNLGFTPVRAMILNPDDNPQQEVEPSASCEAFQSWLDENEDTGGTYTLNEDLIISDSLFIFQPESPIHINAGPYRIIVQNKALLQFFGKNIAITGDGGIEGLIRVAPKGTLLFQGSSLIAENGTAIYFEGGKPTNWSLYIGSTISDTPTVIGAYGHNAKAIVCEQPDPLILGNVSIFTQGNDSTGIYSISDIALSNCTIEAKGENTASLYSQKGKVTGTLCSFSPEASQFTDNGTKWQIKETTNLDFTLPAFTAYKDSGLPDYLNLEVEDCDNPNSTLSITLKVDWDQDAYNIGIEKNEPFTLTGILQQKEGILYNNAKEPSASFTIQASTPIQDLSLETVPGSEQCELIFYFTPPRGATYVKLQKSLDNGVSWATSDITHIYEENDGMGVHISTQKQPGTALYRLKINGSSFAGYSNSVSCNFVPLPATEDTFEDIDGGRGGGGRETVERAPESNIIENILNYPYFWVFTQATNDISGNINQNNLIASASETLDANLLNGNTSLKNQTQSSHGDQNTSKSKDSHNKPNTLTSSSFSYSFLILPIALCLLAAIWWFVRRIKK